MGTDSKVVTGDYYDGTANPPDGIGMGNRDLVAVEPESHGHGIQVQWQRDRDQRR